MAGITTWNKATAPAGTEAWGYTAQVKRGLDTAGLVFEVANATERNGLAALAPGGVLPIPTLIWRVDLGTYETWDGTTWLSLSVVKAGTAVTDGNWTITGGLTKTTTNGLTLVTANLQLTRTNAAINIASGADSALLVGMIPTGFIPSNNQYFIGTANDAGGARYAEPQLVINNGGSLVGRSTSGGGVTIGVGYKLFISTTWWL